MKNAAKKALASAALLSFSVLPFAAMAGEHPRRHASSPHDASAGANPLKEEMRTLNEVFKEIVSGVALADGDAVHTAIESMHGTMEKTRESLHTGEVRTPKNPERMKDFEKMDKDFHDGLESLAMAARDNDQQRMLLVTKKLLDGCVSCHGTFRK